MKDRIEEPSASYSPTPQPALWHQSAGYLFLDAGPAIGFPILCSEVVPK